MAEQSFGIYWCPRCCAFRDFQPVEGRALSPHTGECEECEYTFGYAFNERTGTSTPVLSQAVIEAAVKRKRERVRQEMRDAGVRDEDLDQDLIAKRRAGGHGVDRKLGEV